MSDRQSLITEHLSDGPQTVDQLVELTGLERSAISQELTAMKNAGTAYSGRGGWRLSENQGGTGKPRRHEAVDPPEAPGAAAERASARRRMRAKRAAPEPKSAPAAVVAADRGDRLQPGARYVFGITELGELIVTDRKHAEKTATFSAVDTARLALALKRWATLIGVREAA